ncbi:pupal cuticle protein Edg-78E-like [Haematobia irritans]|uniref:pupal cuticle protein Edg-78E-like n=1 Tax=Haematobia irritans TaxID=7368 RepID=UPI003F4FC8D6
MNNCAADENKEKLTRSQYRPDPYYDGRYYNNRDKYNQRYYNENLLKQYRSDILGKDSRIIEQKLEPAIDGNFAYEFDTENGIHMDAHGTNIKDGSHDEGQKIDGSFAFVTPEGLRVGVHYTSDENGYRPVYTFDGIDSVRYSKPSPAADVTVTKANEGN